MLFKRSARLFVLLALTSSAEAQFLEPSTCLSEPPTPVECTNEHVLCEQLEQTVVLTVIQDVDGFLDDANLAIANLADTERCDVGGSHRYLVEQLISYMQDARDELQTAYDAIVATMNSVPSYALAGHIDGHTRNAVQSATTSTLLASLSAIWCRSTSYESEDFLQLMADGHALLEKLNELSQRAQRCYVSAYLGRDPVSGACE